MSASTSTVRKALPFVAQKSQMVLQAADALRGEAAAELGEVLDGVTGKQLIRANVPTCGTYAVSRSLRGGDNNPLYRVACVFLVMQRLGMGRERAQRIVNWLQEVVDSIWPEAPVDLDEVLEHDQEQDVQDDTPRYRAAMGCSDAVRELLAIKRQQVAYGSVVVTALRRRLAEQAE